jgi:hypothetical protein
MTGPVSGGAKAAMPRFDDAPKKLRPHSDAKVPGLVERIISVGPLVRCGNRRAASPATRDAICDR